VLAELTGYGYRSASGQSPEDAVATAAQAALASLGLNIGDSGSRFHDKTVQTSGIHQKLSRENNFDANGLSPVRIFGNGAGFATLDQWELTGLQKVLAGRKSSVYAVKGAVGETLGAAGALATIAAALSFSVPRAEGEQPMPGTAAKDGGAPAPVSQPEAGLSPVLVSNLEQDGSCVVLALAPGPES